MGDQHQDYVDQEEAAVGTDNPRFKRYHRMVSAPELYNPEAVAKALAILRVQEGVREGRQESVERPESRPEHSDDQRPSP